MSALVRDAYSFAVQAHEGQEKDGAPYIEHVQAVAQLVEDAGYEEEVVAAALLHDVVEHADVTLDAVRTRFGDGVADLVAAMTEPAGVEPWERRKRAHRERIREAGPRAGAIFAADKAANASSLRLALARDGDVDRADEKMDHYRATLDVVQPLDPVSIRLREELDRLSDQRRKRLRFAASSNSHQSG